MQVGRCASSDAATFFRRLRCCLALAAVGAAVCGAVYSSAALAQEKKSEAKNSKVGSPAKAEDLVLHTRDGLQLALTYYPGAAADEIEQGKGKKTIPIVLLHGLKQSRNDYKDLALGLQKLDYAVIVPDLRGHGGSTRRIGDSRDDTLDAAKMAAESVRPDGDAGHAGGQGLPLAKEQRREVEYRQAGRRRRRDGSVGGPEFRVGRHRRTGAQRGAAARL